MNEAREWVRSQTAPVLKILLLALLYYLSASVVLDSLARQWKLGDGWKKSRFERFITLETDRPFVYRVLTPWLIVDLTDCVGEELRASLAARGQELRERYKLREGHDAEYAVAFLLALACLWCVQFAWRDAVRTAVPGAWALADFVPLAVLLFYPTSTHWWWALYDATELALTGWAFALLLRRRRLVFLALAALSVLNKESAIVLVLWALIDAWQERRRAVWIQALVGAMVALALLLAVRTAFRTHPGTGFESHLQENLTYLADPASYWRGTSPYAPALPIPQGVHLLNVLFAGYFLVRGWRLAPLLVRRCALATTAILVPLFLLFGYRDETRVLAPLIPALLVIGVTGWVRRPTSDEGVSVA